MSNEKFVTLRRYDEYYLPGGDLYFLVRPNDETRGTDANCLALQ